MQEHDAERWFLVGRLLATIQTESSQKDLKSKIKDREQLKGHLRLVLNDCEALNLKVSSIVVRNHIDSLDERGGLINDFQDVITACEGISNTIEAELRSILFFRLSDERSKFYERKQLFGEEVENAFPEAISDIEEAGKCLALSRATACVFHLMRIMEVGLRALGAKFKIAYAPSWESYFRR